MIYLMCEDCFQKYVYYIPAGVVIEDWFEEATELEWWLVTVNGWLITAVDMYELDDIWKKFYYFTIIKIII